MVKIYQRFILVVALILALTCPLLLQKADAYLMPADQILYLMGKNFSNYETLAITQSIRVQFPSTMHAEPLLNEKIWLKTPGLYHAESINTRQGHDRSPHQDLAFRHIPMTATVSERMSLLTDMAINLDVVALTRFEGVVAYQLGNNLPESPKLIIEKGSFRPLFLCYWIKKDSRPQPVHIRFMAYKEIENGWYPRKIEYAISDGTVIRYSLVNLETDVPVTEIPLKKIPVETQPPKIAPELREKTKEPQLKEIIKLLKEKYGSGSSGAPNSQR